MTESTAAPDAAELRGEAQLGHVDHRVRVADHCPTRAGPAGTIHGFAPNVASSHSTMSAIRPWLQRADLREAVGGGRG